MTGRSQENDANRSWVAGREEHHAGIQAVYRSVMIRPGIYDDLVSSNPSVREASTNELRTSGGFIAQPDEKDMAMALQYGVTVVGMQGQQVIAFCRHIVDPEKVYSCFCSEFALDSNRSLNNPPQFKEWQGHRDITKRIKLKCIHWVDKEQALVAWQAVRTPLEDSSSRTLAWAIDIAVHAQFQGMGVASEVSRQLRELHPPEISGEIFKTFELRAINGVSVSVGNEASINRYADPDTTPFAWTEEDIEAAEGITLTVRWNHWLKHYLE